MCEIYRTILLGILYIVIYISQRKTQAALGRWSGGRCSKARVQKLENSRPKPGRMEETLEGDLGPPRAVALLEREREIIYIYMCKNIMLEMFLSLDMTIYLKYKGNVYLWPWAWQNCTPVSLTGEWPSSHWLPEPGFCLCRHHSCQITQTVTKK